MKKISKYLISTFFCSTMALGLMLGLANVTSPKMVQANASPITNANNISPEVYRPYDLTLTTDSIIFKEDVNVSDNVTRWDMFILAGSSGETAPIRVDINEFDAEGFKLYEGYCIKANGASEDSANPGGTFKKLDTDTFEITIIPSKINGVKFLGDDKPYIWLVVAPCNPINRLDQIKGTSGHFDVYNSTICLGKFGSIDNFKTVTTLVTIADILPTHFPIRINSDMPENPWLNENGAKLYLISNGTITKLQFDGQGISAGGLAIELSQEVTANNENYIYNFINGYCSATITFNMLNGKLNSVNMINYSSSKESHALLNGTYDGILVHTLKDTHDKVKPTCLTAGHEAYYECDCGAYLSNSDLTEEISDLDAWLAEGGEGYIPPTSHNYQFSEFVWNGFTAKAKYVCTNDSNHVEYYEATITSEVTTKPTCTTTGVRTYTATYDGHTDTRTETLSKIGHHFSGKVTYTWDGDRCTASWHCDHEGCDEIESETVIAAYVKDTDATCETNEKGHYKATFANSNFETQTTATNSVEKENTATGHDTTKVNGQSSTCTKDGYKDAYYCNNCGMYFKNADGTGLIGDSTAYNSWKLNEGKAVKTGHHYSGDVAYTWNDETHECTASWHCDHKGCDDVESETVIATYVKDTDATCETNEKGHYKATFANSNFETQTTATNSVEKENTATGHHYSGDVAYTWNDETHECTASWHCDHKGCDDVESETVIATYVKDTDATCETNEKGHYKATFANSNFQTQTTATNSVEKENTATGHHTTKVNGQSATCTKDGYKDAYYCNDCGMYFKNADGTGLIGDSTAYEVWKLNEGFLPRLLSACAIIGICIGSFFLLLLVIYLIGYFFFYRKGKLDEKKIKVIYKFLPRGKKNLKENEK